MLWPQFMMPSWRCCVIVIVAASVMRSSVSFAIRRSWLSSLSSAATSKIFYSLPSKCSVSTGTSTTTSTTTSTSASSSSITSVNLSDDSDRDRDSDSDSNDKVEDIVRSFLTDKCQIVPDSYVLLSVSGGVDSMAMLHLLAAVGNSSGSMPFNIEVISFNHKLRPESDEEISFVASWASKYGLPFHERILPDSQRSLVGLQARTREWRRNESLALVEAKKRSSGNAGTVSAVYATAHHADDQLETMILKLLRGAFISNLQPMSPRSDCGRAIRPLLSLRKTQIESYMRRNGFDWRDDSSNVEKKYKRNKVRLDVVPAMETVTGGDVALRKRFEALAEQSAELEQWLDREATTFLTSHLPQVLQTQQSGSTDDGDGALGPLLSLDVQKSSAFAHLPSSLVQMEVLRRLCHHCCRTTDDHTDLAGSPDGRGLNYVMTKTLLALAADDLPLGMKEKKLQLHQDLVAVKVGTQLLFERATSRNRRNQGEIDNKPPLVEIVSGSLTVRAPVGMKVAVTPIHTIISSPSSSNATNLTAIPTASQSTSLTTNDHPTAHNGAHLPFVMTPTPSDRLEDPRRPRGETVSVDIWNVPPDTVLTVRYPTKGDRFQPPYRSSPLRVVEYLRHAAIPLHLRSSVPVIALEGSTDGPNIIVAIPPHVAPPFMNPQIQPNGTDDKLPTTSVRIILTR